MRFSRPGWHPGRLCLRIAACALILLPHSAASGREIAATEASAFQTPAPAILMFWAAWCTPCRAEIADFAAIASEAHPVPVFVVSLDTPAKRARDLLTTIPEARLRITPLSTLDVMAKWREAAGLPLAVALDSSGSACAVSNGQLTPSRVKALLARCRDRTNR